MNYSEAEPIYPSFLTGNDLIQLFAKAKKAYTNQTDKLVTAFHVSSFISNPIGTYSSGMVKKLSLILSLIGHPKVILLDEPLVTIDNLSIPVIIDLINEYYEQKGVTFLLTSHQVFEKMKFNSFYELNMRNQTVI